MTEDEFTQAVAELDSPIARMLDEKDAEIERLRTEVLCMQHEVREHQKAIKQAKREALLEAADKFVKLDLTEQDFDGLRASGWLLRIADEL
jgi:nitrogen fixation/metabolism regulation signal transduction histidine kinase